MTTPTLATVEPTVITVKRYVCPFCSRGHSKRAHAVAHIDRCWRNPAVRSCRTCANFVPDASEPEVGYVADEYCAAGIDLPQQGERRVITGCPSWIEAS